jgi:hypothetical protein
MFTIDLLKGSGKPPRSHPLRITGLTLVFAALVGAGILDVLLFLSHQHETAAEDRAMAHYTREIADMADVAQELRTDASRCARINAALAEVGLVTATQTPWSPILMILTEKTPEAITIIDLLTEREVIEKGPNKGEYGYALKLGVISPTGPAPVERFVRNLRTALPLESGPDGIRIILQRQQQFQGRSFQYYAIECRLNP